MIARGIGGVAAAFARLVRHHRASTGPLLEVPSSGPEEAPRKAKRTGADDATRVLGLVKCGKGDLNSHRAMLD